jgi:hypothetical protein
MGSSSCISCLQVQAMDDFFTAGEAAVGNDTPSWMDELEVRAGWLMARCLL